MSTNHPVANGIARPSLQVASMADEERVAIRLLRKILSPRSGPSIDGPESPDLEQAASLIRSTIGRGTCALDGQAGPVGLDVAMPEEPEVTLDERSLLRALAAAQHAEEPALDRALSRLVPAREMRTSLTEAVRALARALAASGRLLASPRILAWSVPAAALTVARLHGHDLGHVPIAWPSRN
ncbi:MAG: hypothetical protein ACRYGI_10255 [Janthinobacterium lividum]